MFSLWLEFQAFRRARRSVKTVVMNDVKIAEAMRTMASLPAFTAMKLALIQGWMNYPFTTEAAHAERKVGRMEGFQMAIDIVAKCASADPKRYAADRQMEQMDGQPPV